MPEGEVACFNLCLILRYIPGYIPVFPLPVLPLPSIRALHARWTKMSVPPPLKHRPARPSSAPWHTAISWALACLLLLPAVPTWTSLPDPPGLPGLLEAQVRAPAVGTVEAALLLRQLDGEKRVLMIGAHPDDEDTSFLATLARGEGARTAYLSLSRGEGGQNLIGPELGEALGIVRTGELVSARSLDGAEQYFTRAFDFGFSKTAEETFGHWPPEELLRDVVRVIRTFRPHVVVSIFAGTPLDGHGQHQASGIVSGRAFDVAGDPERFPEQLVGGVGAWEPLKLYRLTRRDPESATVRIETGALDPLVGRSHFQVAMESRSRHRSQDMGAPQLPGPRQSGAQLLESRVEPPPEGPDGLFAGIDTSLVGIARAARAPDEPILLAAIEAYRDGIREASDLLLAGDPDAVTPLLLAALESLDGALSSGEAAPAGPGRGELRSVLEARREKLGRAILATAGIVTDVRVDRDRIVPGEEAEVELLVWNGGSREVVVENVSLLAPEGWSVQSDGRPLTAGGSPVSMGGSGGDALAAVPPGNLRRWSFRIRTPHNQDPSRLYYLEEEREGSLYRWPADSDRLGLPGNAPLLEGRFELQVEGSTRLQVDRPGSHVGVDGAQGEFRVPVYVVPAVSVETDRSTIAWPRESDDPRTVNIQVTNHSSEELTGRLYLDGPDGWRVEPEDRELRISPRGGETSASFRIEPTGGAVPGRTFFQAVVDSGGQEYTEGLTLVDYPHTDATPFYQPAGVDVSSFPVAVRPGIRVGYIMGSGDGGAQALRDLGVEVETLGPEEVRSGDLGRFDTIVLGIRTYETRPDVVASNDRLLDFARNGGTVVLQYHRYEYSEGNLAPYRIRIRRPHDRVTDPEASVTFLEPDHPALSMPNAISEEDFSGWNQERGLYFLNEWDPAFTPLLEMADPDEAPNRGSLMVAALGDGAYVYTGLALFRQFPQGVPGAYRLLANLVSLRGQDL